MKNLKYEKRLAGSLLLILMLVEISVVFWLQSKKLLEDVPYIIDCLLGELILVMPSIIIMGIWYFIHIWKVSTGKESEEISISDRLMYKGARPTTLMVVIPYTMLVMPMMTFFNIVSMSFTENVVLEDAKAIASMPIYLSLFLIAVVPAFCEEFVFRGVIYGGFRRCCRPVPAIVMSAFLFGLMHLNFNQFLYAFPMGIMAALLVEASGTIWSSVLFHCLVNTPSVISLSFSDELDLALEGQLILPISVYAFYFVTAVITIFLACLLLKWIAKRETRENPLLLIKNSRYYKGISIWSVALVLSIVISVWMMVRML